MVRVWLTTTAKRTRKATNGNYQGEWEKKVPVIVVGGQELRSHVAEVVRQSVEDTLNKPLNEEADRYARPSVMNAMRNVPVLVPATMSAICRPR